VSVKKLPKVLVVGKYRSIVHWVENTATAFSESGCQVQHFALNGDGPWQSLHYKWAQRWHGDANEVIRRDLERALAHFQPDLVLFIAIAALHMPEEWFSTTRQVCPQAHTAVWIGDRLNHDESLFSKHVDQVFATDSAFIEDLRLQGFDVPVSYLPLAVDTWVFRPFDVPRTNRIVYVANNSPGRGEMMRQIHQPISLYGKGWSRLNNTVHDIHPKRLPWTELFALYASSLAALNIRNEKNVVNGLNQRSFEPYGSMTPVLIDDMVDLPRCFEPGKEILVYQSIDELHALYDRLQADNAFARSIGMTGWRRVQAEHTWLHRARSILNAFQ
jgi:spore maturation protein CgeB